MNIKWMCLALLVLTACATKPKHKMDASQATNVQPLEEKWVGPDLKDYPSRALDLDSVENSVDKANKLYTLAMENFLDVAKGDPRTPQLLLWRADAYFQEGLLANAINYYNKLIKEYPNSVQAEKAGKNISLAYAKLGEYGKADDWQKSTKKEADSDQLRLKAAKKKFLDAEQLKKEKRYLKAASKYLHIFTEYSDLKLGEMAIYESGLIFEQLEDWNSAIKSYQKFQERYYDSPKMPEILYHEALAWEQLRAYDRATKKFLNIVRNFPNSPYGEKSLLRVASHFEKAGQLRLSLKVVERYSEIFPNSNRFCEFFQNGDGIGKYEKLGEDFVKINDHYQKNCH